jgi:hypothetical protein
MSATNGNLSKHLAHIKNWLFTSSLVDRLPLLQLGHMVRPTSKLMLRLSPAIEHCIQKSKNPRLPNLAVAPGDVSKHAWPTQTLQTSPSMPYRWLVDKGLEPQLQTEEPPEFTPEFTVSAEKRSNARLFVQTALSRCRPKKHIRDDFP